MARINLLPWRQEERLRKNKEFNIVLGAAAIVAIVCVLATYGFFNGQLEAQNQANAHIESENARLDAINKEIENLEQQKDEMLARMKLIQDLQGKRSIPVRVWDDIARAIPQAMYLTRMTRTDDLITIEGFADNANVVSELVRRLDTSPWLADSRIPNLQAKIEAYQTGVARPQNKDGSPRQSYPEDNYISFTVTTMVKSEDKSTGEGQVDDTNAAAQPATDATTHQAVTEQPDDAMTPVPVDQTQQSVSQPAPVQEPTPTPAQESVPAPAQESVPATPSAQAPAPTDQSPAPAGGQ